MNDEQLRALLQSGQITPAQYEMALDMVMNSPDVSGDMKRNDCYDGQKIMDEKSEEKYLGDVISTDGRNLKTLKQELQKV